MKFEDSLNESFPRFKLSYRGTRDDYQINDKNPYVLALDTRYNVDDNGQSILGINLNYLNDVDDVVGAVNTVDNNNGFRGFEGKLRVKKLLDKENANNYEENKRKQRYEIFRKNFPQLLRYIRRYKNVGIVSKKRKYLK